MHGGAPNKNIGDAFLLVWKFPKGCTVEDIARMTSTSDAYDIQVGACTMWSSSLKQTRVLQAECSSDAYGTKVGVC